MLYQFQCTKCKKTWDAKLCIDDRNKPLDEPCPHCSKKNNIERVFSSTVAYDTKDVTSRIDNGFNDVLQEIHKSAGMHSNVRTK